MVCYTRLNVVLILCLHLFCKSLSNTNMGILAPKLYSGGSKSPPFSSQVLIMKGVVVVCGTMVCALEWKGLSISSSSPYLPIHILYTRKLGVWKKGEGSLLSRSESAGQNPSYILVA